MSSGRHPVTNASASAVSVGTSTPKASAAAAFPSDCWYAVALESDIAAGALVAVRALATSLVLFRVQATDSGADQGAVVALEDRCAHRAYPLSLGRLAGEQIVCGFCGFGYAADGTCVSTPTQAHPPVDAAVRTFATTVSDGVVWVWFGAATPSPLNRPAGLPWLSDDGWASVSGTVDVAANFLLLHESFADVMQVPELAPELSPKVLHTTPPPLDVVVTETTVELRRTFAPGPLPEWQAHAVDAEPTVEFAHEQRGRFVSPGVWIDHWDVVVGADGGDDSGNEPTGAYRMRFTQLVQPVERDQTALRWWVSRDFGTDKADTTATLDEQFTGYYNKLGAALGLMQSILDRDGARTDVNVSADVAALKVRDIVNALVAQNSSAMTSKLSLRGIRRR